MKRSFTSQQAKAIGEQIGVDFGQVSLDEFCIGLSVELEHGAHDPQTNVTNDNPTMTAKIAWAHLKEIPDYYTRLTAMEHDAEGYKTNFEDKGEPLLEDML